MHRRISVQVWINSLFLIFSPQEKRRESIASASTGLRGSTSSLELYSKSLEQDRQESKPGVSPKRRLSSSGKTSSSTDLSRPVPPRAPSIVPQETSMPRPKLLPTLGAVMSMKGPPEITGISPRYAPAGEGVMVIPFTSKVAGWGARRLECGNMIQCSSPVKSEIRKFFHRFGPSSGGTKITIRGCNLGTNTGDFLGFTICSVDHLDSLEYHTPAKLVCITQSWDGKKPNPGPIILVTKSGGRGVSTIQFEFQGDPVVTKKKNSIAKAKGSSSVF